jgi:hypothetical protein
MRDRKIYLVSSFTSPFHSILTYNELTFFYAYRLMQLSSKLIKKSKMIVTIKNIVIASQKKKKFNL